MKKFRIVLLLIIFIIGYSEMTFASNWEPINPEKTFFLDRSRISKLNNSSDGYVAYVKMMIPDSIKQQYASTGKKLPEYLLTQFTLDNQSKTIISKSIGLFDGQDNVIKALPDTSEKYKMTPGSNQEKLYIRCRVNYMLPGTIWSSLGRGSHLEIGSIEKLKNSTEEIYRYWILTPMKDPNFTILIYDEVNLSRNTYKVIYRTILTNPERSVFLVEAPNSTPSVDKNYIDGIKGLLKKYAR